MEKPIIFNTDDVRAILDGRKTQTRRIVNLKSHYGKAFHGFVLGERVGVFAQGVYPILHADERVTPPCMPADTLWVRETWARHPDYPGTYRAIYRADIGAEFDADRWRPSIHMPRWASRITLQVEAVRVERVQDITDADAIAEGEPNRTEFMWGWRHAYGYPWWGANPLVWVIEFKRIQP